MSHDPHVVHVRLGEPAEWNFTIVCPHDDQDPDAPCRPDGECFVQTNAKAYGFLDICRFHEGEQEVYFPLMVDWEIDQDELWLIRWRDDQP